MYDIHQIQSSKYNTTKCEGTDKMKRVVIGIVIAVAIALVVGYTLGQQTDIRRTNSALAEIELTLAENERQQMEAQTLLLTYQMKLTQLYQQYDAIWARTPPSGTSYPYNFYAFQQLDARNVSSQITKYRELAEEQAERLYRLQLEHERLLKQKLELLRK